MRDECRMRPRRLKPSGGSCNMERYVVQVTEEALSDMEEIYRYIAEKLLSPENALGQYNHIADEILSLNAFPERYRLVDFEPEHSAGLRRMLVDNYSVFYVVRENCVIVTDVLYSASDIEKRLRERHE